MMESKKQIYNLIPKKYYPRTELVKAGTSIVEINKVLENSGIKYPFIAKPDIGLRGSAVKKIETPDDLKQYTERANFDFIVQDLIPYENEIGVFYVRYPHEKVGRITGIVAKEFLIITGNGVATIEELIKENPRYELQLKVLKQEYGSKLREVLPEGEKINLVPYGNHARGAKFIDVSHWLTPKLTDTFNEMCVQIPGFYFGRLDIMYGSFEDLEKGINFSVVELNGAASETNSYLRPQTQLVICMERTRSTHYLYV